MGDRIRDKTAIVTGAGSAGQASATARRQQCSSPARGRASCSSTTTLMPPRRPVWDSLPFVPTRAQRRVVAEIVAQMQRPQVMNRLVQGDVGSGKTLVGLCTMLTAVENG